MNNLRFGFGAFVLILIYLQGFLQKVMDYAFI
jgi:hypothetical protein